MSNKGTRIDLESRNKGKNNHSRSDYVTLLSYRINEKTLDELADLAEVLEKVGISLSVDRYETAENESGYDIVTFKVNEEQYKKITNRYAGRKRNFIEKYEKYALCTVKELREYLDRMSKTEIAALLGCSRMTLYRIIQNIEELKPEEDSSIWHYTSGKQ